MRNIYLITFLFYASMSGVVASPVVKKEDIQDRDNIAIWYRTDHHDPTAMIVLKVIDDQKKDRMIMRQKGSGQPLGFSVSILLEEDEEGNVCAFFLE